MGDNLFVSKQNIGNPPMFDGQNFSYWKIRMSAFVDAIDDDLWSIIKDGIPSVPINLQNGPNGRPTMEYQIMKRLEKFGKHLTFSAMSQSEFIKVSTCKSGKEIWDNLVTMYVETYQIKESKMNLLIHQYENFTTKCDETIKEMFERLNLIVDTLEHLGKFYNSSENVRKILRILPKSLEAKKTAIDEANYISTLPLE